MIFGNKAAMAEKNVSDRKESYTGVQKDALTGFKVIKSFKAEKSISNLHEQKNEDVADASNKRFKASVLVSYSSSLSSAVVQFGVFFVAAAFALSGKGVTVGTVLVFVQLLNYLLRPIQLFPNFFAGRQSALRLMEKLAVALNQNVSDEGEPIAPPLTEGISIRDLHFAYEENKPVLSGIDMDIDENDTIPSKTVWFIRIGGHDRRQILPTGESACRLRYCNSALAMLQSYCK